MNNFGGELLLTRKSKHSKYQFSVGEGEEKAFPEPSAETCLRCGARSNAKILQAMQNGQGQKEKSLRLRQRRKALQLKGPKPPCIAGGILASRARRGIRTCLACINSGNMLEHHVLLMGHGKLCLREGPRHCQLCKAIRKLFCTDAE